MSSDELTAFIAKARKRWNKKDVSEAESGWIAHELRSPEGRAVVARALGLLTHSQAFSAQQGIERAARRETALKIADAIEKAADDYNEMIATLAGVPKGDRDGMVSSGIRRAATVARSFTEEDSGQVQAMLSSAVDRLDDPLTVDRPEDIRARLESSDDRQDR